MEQKPCMSVLAKSQAVKCRVPILISWLEPRSRWLFLCLFSSIALNLHAPHAGLSHLCFLSPLPRATAHRPRAVCRLAINTLRHGKSVEPLQLPKLIESRLTEQQCPVAGRHQLCSLTDSEDVPILHTPPSGNRGVVILADEWTRQIAEAIRPGIKAVKKNKKQCCCEGNRMCCLGENDAEASVVGKWVL